jgi:hypothetical protein
VASLPLITQHLLAELHLRCQSWSMTLSTPQRPWAISCQVLAWYIMQSAAMPIAISCNADCYQLQCRLHDLRSLLVIICPSRFRSIPPFALTLCHVLIPVPHTHHSLVQVRSAACYGEPCVLWVWFGVMAAAAAKLLYAQP